MTRLALWIPTVVVATLIACPAAASRLVVPDQQPTIQAAIDAGADTVAVRDGLAPERLTVARSVAIEPVLGHGFLPYWTSVPTIRSLAITTQGVTLSLRGLRVLGGVTSTALVDEWIVFDGCRFDSSFTCPGSKQSAFVNYSVRNCMILGSVELDGYVQFVGNTVIGGTATLWSDGSHDIRNNYVSGASGPGLYLKLQDSEGPIEGNTIANCGEGIRVYDDGFGDVIRNNVITGCSGNGFTFESRQYTSVTFDVEDNTIENCGGAGLATGPPWMGKVLRNRISDVQGDGIALPAFSFSFVDSNTVLHAGGVGIRVGSPTLAVIGNIVGRCAGDGIVLGEGSVDAIRGNTCFANGGAGLSIASGSAPAANIGAFNAGAGIVILNGAPVLGCNDWFGNGAGAVQGGAPGATDLALDPQFCGLAANDVHLAANSPLAGAPGCGLIGALGVGCGSVGAVEGRDEPTGLRAWPVPARGAIAFDVPRVLGATHVEVFDVTGALCWRSAIPAGATHLEWDGREGAGGAAPAGVYFARVVRAGTPLGTVRLVLAR
jgi:parallel beta-helix repeat protein